MPRYSNNPYIMHTESMNIALTIQGIKTKRVGEMAGLAKYMSCRHVELKFSPRRHKSTMPPHPWWSGRVIPELGKRRQVDHWGSLDCQPHLPCKLQVPLRDLGLRCKVGGC